jgi:hypothetical protein
VRDDHAFPFQFQIGSLDRDDAHLKIGRKLADGGDRLSFRPVPESDPLLDLVHDLEIHGPLVGLRDGESTAHLNILSIYR